MTLKISVGYIVLMRVVKPHGLRRESCLVHSMLRQLQPAA